MPDKKTAHGQPGRTGEGERPTKKVILDATEELIAKHGVRAVSIRDIAHAARVNLAAINYHFGSKDGLLRAVLERRISSAFTRRMAALEAIEQAGRPVTAEALMEAYLGPYVACDAKTKRRHERVARMMSHFFFEEEAMIGAVAKTRIEPFLVRFTSLLKKMLPSVPEAELAWRSSLAMGVLHHHLMVASIRKYAGGRHAKPGDVKQWLVTFCTAGLRAPASAQAPATRAARKGPARKK